jgi:hypothetical protein
MLNFPQQASGKPWARLDARTGILFVSSADGEKSAVDMKGKTFGLDIANAKQGWLMVGAAGVDWQEVNGAWGNPPSADHKPGVDVTIYSKDASFGDAPFRSARGNSRAWTQFVADVAKKAGLIPAGKLATLRVDAVKTIKVGQGTSVQIDFTLAPKEKWYSAEEASAAPAPAPTSSSDDEEF